MPELDRNEAICALSTIMKTANDIMFIKDNKLIYRCVSSSFARLVGLESPEAAVGKTDEDFFDKDTARAYTESNLRLLSNSEEYSYNIDSSIDIGGKRRYISCFIYKIFSTDGDVLGVYGVGKDIADKSFAVSELETGDSCGNVTVATYDIASNTIKTNFIAPNLTGILSDGGVSPEQWIKHENIHPDSVDELLGLFGKMSRGDAESGAIVKIRDLSENFRSFTVSYNLVGESDNPLYAIITVDEHRNADEPAGERQNEAQNGNLYLVFNLTGLVCTDVIGTNRLWRSLEPVGKNYDYIMSSLAGLYVVPNEREDFLSYTDKARLVSLAKAGISGEVRAFRFIHDSSLGSFAGVNVSLQLSMNDETGEIKLYFLASASKKLVSAPAGVTVFRNESFVGRLKELVSVDPAVERAFVLIDIDNFRRVLADVGSLGSGRLLDECVSSLASMLRENEIIGRLGGDEFILLLISDESRVQLIARLGEALRIIERCGHSDIHVTASIGVSMYPTDGKSFDELHSAAKSALYRSKIKGRNRFEIFGFDGKDNSISAINAANGGESAQSGNISDFFGGNRTETERQLELYQMTQSGGVFIVAADEYRFIYANDICYTLFGYDPKEADLSNAFIGKYVHPEDLEKSRTTIDRLKRSMSSELFDIEIRIICADKSYKYVLLHSRFAFSNGKAVIVGFATDISAQKAAEDRFRLQYETMSIVIRQNNCQVAYLDIKTRVLYPQDSFKLVFNNKNAVYDIPESVVKSGIVSEDTADAYRDFYQAMFNGEKEGHTVVRFLDPVKSVYYWTSCRFTMIYDSAKRPERAVISYSQLTKEQYIDDLTPPDDTDKERETILIVDDSEMNRAILVGIFAPEYEILQACDGVEALEILNSDDNRISIMLLDIIMPRMDGIEVLSRIRENPALKGLSTIIVSAADERKFAVQAMALGASDYILKPVDPEFAKIRVLTALERRRAEHLKFENFMLRVQKDENLVYQNRLKHLAEHDRLTGIMNRDTFIKNAQDILNSAEPSAYILSVLDIDRFKAINDTLGHKLGDDLLKYCASKLKFVVSKLGGLCCRLSDDKFASLLKNNPPLIKSLAGIRDNTIKEFGLDFEITTSTGRYVVDDLSLSVSSMLDRASLAHERAKNYTGTHDVLYSEEMRANILREQEYTGKMKAALENGEFVVYAQPQLNHKSGEIVGAEVLVRWIKPNGEIISPAIFIPIFEKNGFIVRLDRFVWEEACRLIRRMQDEGKGIVPISVNVSIYDLRDNDIVETLLSLIEKYEINPRYLRLEITESAFAKYPRRLVDMVERLQSHGFVIEMDDFGSGYSSLNILKEVPFDIVKLDMKFFIGNENGGRGGNIIGSVVRMIKWLNLPIIAEGVETRAQADFLLSIGCIYIQGFLYAEPMPTDKFIVMLNKNSASAMPTDELESSLNLRVFWDPDSSETFLFNNHVGASAIGEYRNGTLEILRVNDRLPFELRLEGSEMDDFRKDLFRVMSHGEATRFRELLDEVIETGDDRSIDFKRIIPSIGEELWMRVEVQMIGSTSDSRIFFITIEDVTAQTKLDYSLMKTNKELAEKLVSSISEGGMMACTYELDSHRLVPNKATTRNFGLESITLNNVPESLIRSGMIHKDDCEALTTAYRRLLSGEDAVSVVIRRRKNIFGTEWQSCRLMLTVIWEKDGSRKTAICIANDIGEKEHSRRKRR